MVHDYDKIGQNLLLSKETYRCLDFEHAIDSLHCLNCIALKLSEVGAADALASKHLTLVFSFAQTSKFFGQLRLFLQ